MDRLVALLGKRNIATLGAGKGRVIDALLRCRDSGWVSFADALIQVEAESHGLTGMYTCDQRFPTNGVPVQFLSSD